MKKLPPSERISKEISALLEKGMAESQQNVLSTLIRQSVKKFIQEVLEQEIHDYLGRGYYHRGERKRKGYRNGYEGKRLKSAEGPLDIEIPQLRDTDESYRSQLIDSLETRSSELERLVVEMYTRGLSTRDIEDTLRDGAGRCTISKSGVSEITASLNEEYERFCQRDLSDHDVVYLFVDGVYESLRLEASFKEAILCAWAILSNGRKVLLHLGLGNRESAENWRDFFRNMISRGLRMPLLICSDGAPGLIKAIEECFPQSRRQRCLAHKLRNIANKLPRLALDEVMAKVRQVYYQGSKEIAMMCAAKLVEGYADRYPGAIKCFQEDLQSCLNYMDFPEGHHKHIRTTNLLERCFGEQKRRTKVIPRFLNEKSGLKLVYGTLIRVSEKWRKVKMSEYDLVVLKKLRAIYGWKEDGQHFISKKIAA